MNVKERFEELYQMGDKSGIWRFYRRVWKNIFYERGDKEREGGFLEMGGGKFGLRRMGREERENLYFFKNFQRGGEEFETL